MAYLGDLRLGDTLDTKFCTVDTTGAPFALSGGTVSAYVDNSATQITSGVTLTADFDSVTGLNHVRVVASSGNGFTAAMNVQLVVTAGTVDGTSIAGYVVGEFSIAARAGARTVADSIPALGSRPTMEQAAYLLTQFMTNRDWPSGSTVMTVTKPDGTTTLMTFDVDDADDPRSQTRAT